MSISFDSIYTSLTNLDFLSIQRFTTPTGTVWHAFAAGDADSWWHDEPICWEIFIADITASSPPSAPPMFYVHGTLLSPGLFVSTECEWAAALARLLPDGEGWTRMEEVD